MSKWFRTKKDVLEERRQEENMYKAKYRNILSNWTLEEKYRTTEGLPLLPEGFCWEVTSVLDLNMLDEPFRNLFILGPRLESSAIVDYALHNTKVYGEMQNSTAKKVSNVAFQLISEIRDRAISDGLTGRYPPMIFPKV